MAQKAVTSEFKDATWVPPTQGSSARRLAGRSRRLSPQPQRAADLSVELISVDMIDDEFRSEWRALGNTAEHPNPYFESWFLEPALVHLDLKKEVRLCVIRKETGKLVGLLPVVFQSGYCKLPLKHVAVWMHQHCYDGTPLIARGLAAEVHSAILDMIDTRPGGARFFRYQHLPYRSETEAVLLRVCDSRGRRVREQDRHERAILTRETDFDALIQRALSGKKRKELRRLEARFAEIGDTRFADLPVDDMSLEAFVTLENAGWKSADPFGFPFARCTHAAAFFREAMRAGARENAIQCLALMLNSRPVAMLFSLHAGQHLSAFKTSYDERYSAYSPGFRLIMEATRQMLESEEISVYDSCARQGHPVVERLWSGRMPIVQINIASARWSDKTLLALAATLEKLKLAAVRCLTKLRRIGE